MYAEHFDEGSNGWQEAGEGRWQEAGEGRSNGWPLGLQQPLHNVVRRGFAEAPSLFITTPSITSESSSDLDTESTGSFFPEKSTTLGSLIGIPSSSHSEQSKALVVAHQVMESERRKSVGGARSRTSWCPMLGCGGGSNPEALGMSPSLAHLLEEERRATGSQRHAISSMEEVAHYTATEDEGELRERGSVGIPSLLVQRNTLFDDEGILPPRPAGAPLKLILQHTSPSSSYLSADWNVFNGRHPHHSRGGGEAGPSHGRFPTFWPSFCGSRLGTGLSS